jgi:diguanylate cyclase (GGDEF)-like protein
MVRAPSLIMSDFVMLSVAFGGLTMLIVRLPGGTRISAAYPVLFAALINRGAYASMAMTLPGIIVRIVHRRESPLYALYLFGQLSMSCFVATWAYVLTGAEIGGTMLPGGLASLLIAGLSFDIVNVGFAQGRVVLQDGGNWFKRWWYALFQERGLAMPIYHALGLTTALLYQDRGALGLALACLPLLGLHIFFRLHAQFSETKRLAETDRLTQVYNYRYLSEWLQQEFPRVTEGTRPLSVLWVDVDSLKGINDNHGHEAGNEALRYVADVLKANTRQTDTVARYGGDEFVVVLPDLGSDEAQRVVERVHGALGAEPFVYCGHRLQVGLSIGAASFPSDAQTPQELLTASDRAMYQIKQVKRVHGITRTAT